MSAGIAVERMLPGTPLGIALLKIGVFILLFVTVMLLVERNTYRDAYKTLRSIVRPEK